jgi:hypothetical protein
LRQKTFEGNGIKSSSGNEIARPVIIFLDYGHQQVDMALNSHDKSRTAATEIPKWIVHYCETVASCSSADFAQASVPAGSAENGAAKFSPADWHAGYRVLS